MISLSHLSPSPLCRFPGINHRSILISCLIVARKMWEDSPLKNTSYVGTTTSMTLKQINALERCILRLLKYKTTIMASLYAQYYFELRSLQEANGIGNPITGPLSSEEREALHVDRVTMEERSLRYADRLQHDKRVVAEIRVEAVSSSPCVMMSPGSGSGHHQHHHHHHHHRDHQDHHQRHQRQHQDHK